MSNRRENDDDPTENAVFTSGDDEQTATAPRWTRWLPESYGIRAAVEQSKYRWCAREAGMWGIATGTAMGLHRIRMSGNGRMTTAAGHAGFATALLVMTGSYVLCARRRDHQEQMIELLMRLNSFEPAQTMPEERPVDDGTHPFVEPAASGVHDEEGGIPERQFVANLPERKEWQEQLPTAQDAEQVFRPADETRQ